MNDFKRNILLELEEWRKRTNRKPLVIRGARQVGKTTVVRQFASQFKYFISLNLESEGERAFFRVGMDVEVAIKGIEVHSKTPLTAETLLFIDEIQNEPQAVQMLRYFYEKHPEICVIAAGSLLESYAGKTFSFPVGRVEFLSMHPCSFFEFMGAMGDESDLQSLLDGNAVYIHDRLMRQFRLYTLLGGMPEAVSTYATTRDFSKVERVYASLLTSYQDDVEKYAESRTQAAVIRHILQNGWAFAGEIVTYERFAGSAYKSREVSEAFLTLQKSMLLETVYPSFSTAVPLMRQYTHHPKLLWLDTGLVNYAAGLRDEVFLAADLQDVYRGRIAEHVVGQELLALSDQVDSQRAFWQKSGKSEAEVDYLYLFGSKLIPIEVKSGSNAHLRSLQTFMALAPHDISVRVWSKPFSVDEVANPLDGKKFRLVNLPFYMVGMLPEVLGRLV